MSRMTPFVKWAGGKKQIISEILTRINNLIADNGDEYTFHEPFVGGGIVFLSLAPKKAIINDLNSELINAYEVIRDDPHELIKLLNKMKTNFGGIPKYYYDIRALDRDENVYSQMTKVEKAARMIFLNKTCYNGLYRVNSKGQFNTPMGRYKNPSIYDEKNILMISNYLNENDITIKNGDYSDALEEVEADDIIYMDPPYHYEDENGFTLYQKEGFTFEDFEKLKKKCDNCIVREAHIIISNNETKKVRKLFEEDPRYVVYDIKKINTRRSINSKGSERNTGKELLATGIPTKFPQANDVNKIVKLIAAKDESIFLDSEKIREIIGPSEERTVQYYLSSLKFLGVIDNMKHFSTFGIELSLINNFEELRKEVAKYIIGVDIFEKIFLLEHNEKRLTPTQIVRRMSYLKKKYSASTLKRRANTVRAWVDWCWDVLGGTDDY